VLILDVRFRQVQRCNFIMFNRRNRRCIEAACIYFKYWWVLWFRNKTECLC